MRGVDVVVHCAGAVRGWRARFQETNVDGTRRLVRALLRDTAGPVPHVVFVSSLAAREPHLSPYAASKRAAERVLEEEFDGVPWTALRPPAVYGPGDREILPLFSWMARGLAPVLGREDARFSLLYVDDLVECLARLAQHAGPTRGVREIHDGRVGGYDWNDVRAAVARLSGRPVRRVRVPLPLLRLLAALNLGLRSSFGSTGSVIRGPLLTPGKVRELYHPDWVCDDSTLRAETGWRPRVSLAEGLRRTLFPTAPVAVGVPQTPCS